MLIQLAVCVARCLSFACWCEQSFLGWRVPKFRIEKQHLMHEIWRWSWFWRKWLCFYINKFVAITSTVALSLGRWQQRFDWQSHIRKRVMNHKTRVKGKLTQQLTGDWYIELEVFNLAAELTRSLYNKLRCLRGNISPDGSLFSAFTPSLRLPMRGLVDSL